MYGTESERLLFLSDGRCYQYRDGARVADLSTKGPIQHALRMNQEFWVLSGWREEVALRHTGVHVVKQDEVVVQHLVKDEQLWLLTNDGYLHHSFLTE